MVRAAIKNMNDKDILELYRSGDCEKAFGALVETYSERVYWLLRRFTSSHEDTDDLLQEVLLKAWTAMPNFRGDARLFTWLYRVATNEALNYIRKNKVKALLQRESLDLVIDRLVDEDVSFNGNELQRELLKAVKKLPAKQQAVFNLRYYDELSYEDISKITGTSVGALKASYHHAYIKVKEQLEKKF